MIPPGYLNETCPKCGGAGGPRTGRAPARYEDVCDFCDGAGLWPEGRPCPLGQHDYRWFTQPGTAWEPAEHLKICARCGAEYPGSDVDD